jgi:hypothetical protein
MKIEDWRKEKENMSENTRVGLLVRENGFLKYGKWFISHVGLVEKIDPERDFPPRKEDVEVCKKFVKKWIDRSEKINKRDFHSYGLKHAVESLHEFETGDKTLYITEGSFIQSAAELGFNVEPIGQIIGGGQHSLFNMNYTRLKKYKKDHNLAFI